MSPSRSNSGHAVPVCAAQSLEIDLDEFVWFPTDQPGGHALAVLLEPCSKFGLHRFADFGLALQSGMRYPIVRG